MPAYLEGDGVELFFVGEVYIMYMCVCDSYVYELSSWQISAIVLHGGCLRCSFSRIHLLLINRVLSLLPCLGPFIG